MKISFKKEECVCMKRVDQMSQICYGHFLALVICRQYNVGGSVGWTSSKEHVKFVRWRKDTHKKKRREGVDFVAKRI